MFLRSMMATRRDQWMAIWTGWSFPTRFVVLLAVMVIGYKLAIAPARYHWYPPAGFCMAAFVLLAPRYWMTVVLAEWYHRLFWMNLNWWFSDDLPNLVVTTFIQFVPTMLVAAWYRPIFETQGVRDVRGVSLMLLAMFAEAVAGALTNGLLMFTGYFGHEFSTVRFLLDIMLGNGIGNFVSFAPMLALASRPLHAIVPVLRSLLIWVVPALAGLLLLSALASDGLPPGYLRILAQLPCIVVAWLHGWQGAVFAFALSSSANRYFKEVDTPFHALDPTAEMTTQMVVVVLGIASYVLGAAATALRERQAELERRNRELIAANTEKTRLAEELRDVAQRNLQLETAQRREIATALHDELGQNLTAMTVRLKLVGQSTDDASALDPLREMIDRMRASVRRLLDNLSPAALDEFGLRRALHEGPVRDMVEDAGLGYRVQIIGNSNAIDALPGHLQSSVYRIIQETATNTVRHARASAFDVRLRLGRRNEQPLLLLDIRDNGSGITPSQNERRRYGIQGIRDRVLASDGVMHLRSDARGTRLHVMLRVELGEMHLQSTKRNL